MKNTLPLMRIIVTILLLCVAILGVYLANVTKSLNQQSECDITHTNCTLMPFNQLMRVKFKQQPVTEEELFLRFSLNDAITIENAWVEGVNMYMGKTPVLFENKNNTNIAVVFLGSCNLQKMQWRLYVNVKNNATAEVALMSVTFATYTE